MGKDVRIPTVKNVWKNVNTEIIITLLKTHL